MIQSYSIFHVPTPILVPPISPWDFRTFNWHDANLIYALAASSPVHNKMNYSTNWTSNKRIRYKISADKIFTHRIWKACKSSRPSPTNRPHLHTCSRRKPRCWACFQPSSRIPSLSPCGPPSLPPRDSSPLDSNGFFASNCANVRDKLGRKQFFSQAILQSKRKHEQSAAGHGVGRTDRIIPSYSRPTFVRWAYQSDSAFLRGKETIITCTISFTQSHLPVSLTWMKQTYPITALCLYLCK